MNKNITIHIVALFVFAIGISFYIVSSGKITKRVCIDNWSYAVTDKLRLIEIKDKLGNPVQCFGVTNP